MHLEHMPGHTDLDPAAQARIEHAYASGDSHGLLHLGAVELTTWLPPSLAYGRELAQGFMARLCAIPDLAQRWDNVQVATPADELERLLAAVPPMTGAEYLDA
jgi:non-specific serine/threonine protein kinase